MRSRLYMLGMMLALSAVVFSGCGPVATTPAADVEEPTAMPEAPTVAPTEIVVESPNPLRGRDAALAYVSEHYGEQAPAPGLSWVEELTTPEGLVGSSTFQYTADGWEITVSFPVVAPESVIYQVLVANPATGFRWEGKVDARGHVTEQSVVKVPDAVYGISFSYDDTIAAEVVPETVPPEEYPMPDMGVMPEHTKLSFYGYALPETFHEPRIHIYPISDLEAGWENATTIVAQLQQLLAEKPAAPEAIPFLPVFNAAQMMRTQIAYIDFRNGTGVRFLTQYGQAYAPINNYEMFYTFQGLTRDGEYYVAAVLPTSHPSLPADGTEIPGDDYEAFAENFESYASEIEQQLDAQDTSSFTPDLSLLDAMIRSLVVAPASTVPPDTEDNPYLDWDSYVNTDYMFAFRYPPTWTIEQGPNLVKLSQGTLLLAIAFQGQGEDVPPPWTGMPAGDFESRGTMAFMGQEIDRNALIYEGKVKVLTYGASVGDMIFSMRLDDMVEQASSADYAAIEIPEAVQAEVDQIVESFQVLPQ